MRGVIPGVSSIKIVEQRMLSVCKAHVCMHKHKRPGGMIH